MSSEPDQTIVTSTLMKRDCVRVFSIYKDQITIKKVYM